MNVQIKNVVKSFGRNKVLKDISLAAESGSCVGIIGANGAGKSTLLSVLAGVLQPSQGQFLVDGKDLFINRKRRAMVGYVPQGTPLIEELSARDNLLLWYTRAEMEKQLKTGVLKILEIDTFLKTPVRKLSGGMKKRLSIGCAMATKPPILLLDEPTAALDIACKQSIAQYLQIYKQAGGIILLASHDLMELEQCDKLYILKEGILHDYIYTGNMLELIEKL